MRTLQAMKTLAGAAGALALAMLAPSMANADVYYTFTENGAFFGNAAFVYDSPSFLTADATVTPQYCEVTSGACNQASFDLSPNSFGGTDDEISFGPHDTNGGSSTGFFFFQQGALSQYGKYSDAGYPMNTPGFGNAAPAMLQVSDMAPASNPVPAPASGGPEPSTWALMMVGVFGAGIALRRRQDAGLAALA